jgi:hypothetical protein
MPANKRGFCPLDPTQTDLRDKLAAAETLLPKI